MMSEINKPELIAYLFGVNNERDINFRDNIILTRISKKERNNFSKFNKEPPTNMKFNRWQLINDSDISNCLKFRLDESKCEEEGPAGEYYLIDACWKLSKLTEAINIAKKEPCTILRIDLYNNNEYIDTVERTINNHYYHGEFETCVISKEDVKSIMKITNLLLKADKGNLVFKDLKKYWWLNAKEYFIRYLESDFISDQTINLTIALESLLSGNDNSEMRYRFSHRASLYLYDIAGYYPNQIQDFVKKMYDLRSKIVHGSKMVQNSEKDVIKLKPENIELKNGIIELTGGKIDFDVGLLLLREIIRQMLFDAMLNHSNKSKLKFLEYIDNSWYKLDDMSKFKVIDDSIFEYSIKTLKPQ